jgi:hypothetical protein
VVSGRPHNTKSIFHLAAKHGIYRRDSAPSGETRGFSGTRGNRGIAGTKLTPALGYFALDQGDVFASVNERQLVVRRAANLNGNEVVAEAGAFEVIHNRSEARWNLRFTRSNFVLPDMNVGSKAGARHQALATFM